ncbi:MAG: methyl-accepting chemotaxis protein [Firmicutes bacterium]|nr:methyl-accepting chemotaxis protein [Bacillota bacterium]
MKLNVKGEIILFTLPIFIGLAALLIIFGLYQFTSLSNDLTTQKVQITTNILLSEIEYVSFIAPVVAESLASNQHFVDALETGDLDALNNLILQSTNAAIAASFFSVADANGTVLLRTYDDAVGDSIAGNWYFPELAAGNTVTFTGSTPSMQLATISVTPVHTYDDEIIGFLATGIRWDSEEYMEVLQEYYLAEFAIFIGNTAVTTSLIDNTRFTGLVMEPEVFQAVMVQGQHYLGEITVLGHAYSAVYVPFLDSNGQPIGAILSAISLEQMQAAFARTTIGMIAFAIVGIILALIMLIFVANRITKPIKWLTKWSKEISRGNLQTNHLPPTFAGEELRTLADSINAIVINVKAISEEIGMFNNKFSKEGDIEWRINSDKFKNDFKNLTLEINSVIDTFVEDMLYFINSVEKVAFGDFNLKVNKLPGKRIVLSNSLQHIIHTLKNLQQSVSIVANSASNGDLTVRVHENKFEGSWVDLAKEINMLIVHVEKPLLAIETSLSEISSGNFEKAYITETYNGTFENVKNMLNNTTKITLDYIEEISKDLQDIAAGNLNISVKNNFVGVYKEVQQAMQNIISTLSRTMGEIQDASDEVLAKANLISQYAMNLSNGSQQQANSIYALNDSVEAIYKKANEANQNTLTATSSVKSSQDYTAAGNESVEIMTNAMTKIRASSEGISKIISAITSIAFQTNLLALNASVEAARAGEHGKGFSVVADEVRTLAVRSQQSAADTTNLIEESSNSVKDGLHATEEVVSSFENISNAINEISNIMTLILEISDNQLESIATVNANVSDITQIVKSNSQTAEETSSVSEELNHQAELLKEKVSYFKLR